VVRAPLDKNEREVEHRSTSRRVGERRGPAGRYHLAPAAMLASVGSFVSVVMRMPAIPASDRDEYTTCDGSADRGQEQAHADDVP